jgi:transposase
MGRRQINKVKLNKNQREKLLDLTHCGKKSVSQIKKAQILLLANQGKKDSEIANLLNISNGSVYGTRRRFCQEGLKVLKRRPVCGRPKKIDGKVEAQTIATALSDPPTGKAGWTLRMIADHIVELNVIPSISYQSVRRILKKKRLNLG